MRTRQEIKAIGKQSFKANYWNCVLAALLVTAVLSVLGWLSGGEETLQMVNNAASGNYPAAYPAAYAGDTTVSVRSNAGSMLSLLLSGPLTVGLSAFFIRNLRRTDEELTVTTPFTEAFRNYPRKLGGMLWKSLFLFLWTLLFIIPGLIKAFSYAMTENILADCPNVKATDALKLSMRMMNGHKGELFVMYLSFLGWGLLSVLTLGILSIFYVEPYRKSSLAAYYLEVRDDALRRGVVTWGQLDGTEGV